MLTSCQFYFVRARVLRNLSRTAFQSSWIRPCSIATCMELLSNAGGLSSCRRHTAFVVFGKRMRWRSIYVKEKEEHPLLCSFPAQLCTKVRPSPVTRCRFHVNRGVSLFYFYFVFSCTRSHQVVALYAFSSGVWHAAVRQFFTYFIFHC